MGFRDLHELNLALLAKQLWRLLHFPSSLLARVLRSRYYHKSNLLQDQNVYSPSCGWNSIIAAKNLLKQGLQKTNWSGCNTKAWNEPLIPDKLTRLPRSNHRHTMKNSQLLVRDLMRHNSMEWNETLIRELFHPEDVVLILGIRPSRRFNLDGYAWSYTKSGTYTVKSDYDLVHNSNTLQENRQIPEPSITYLLRQVWKIKTPTKLKHFMWQALAGCVATCPRLTFRHLGNDKSCPKCGAPEKTINHVIFECPTALQVWALSEFPSLPGNFLSTSLFQNMDFFFWRTEERGLHIPMGYIPMDHLVHIESNER